MEKEGSIIRIAIVGPESTGKSTLCEYLAKEYKTNWVPEYAREFLEGKLQRYTKDDVVSIAKEQMRREDEMAASSNKILFCDTNLLVIKIWMMVVFGEVDDWVNEEIKKREYPLQLLCDIDHPWVQDSLREHPDRRVEIQNLYVDELNKTKANYTIVRGSDNTRLLNAKNCIEEFLSTQKK